MVKERTGSSVRPLQLAYMIYGGREAFERMKEIQVEMEAEPVFDRYVGVCLVCFPSWNRRS